MDELLRCSPEPSKSEPVIDDSTIEEQSRLDPIENPADHERQVTSSAVPNKSEHDHSTSSIPVRVETQPVTSSSRGNTEIEPVSLIDQMKTSSNPCSIASDENRSTEANRSIEAFDISSINKSDNDTSSNDSLNVCDTVTSSAGDDNADYDSFQSQDDKVLFDKSQDTSDKSDKDSSHSYEQVECIHHRLIGSCDDCLRKVC